MRIELREIFNDVVTRLNKVATKAQLEVAFKSACRLFFEEVVIYVDSPIKEGVPAPMVGQQIVIDKTAFPPVIDMYGLGVGNYRIVRVKELDYGEGVCYPLSNLETSEKNRYWSIGISPIDFNVFKLPINYQNSFELVIQHYLNELEKDNLQYAQQLGIQYVKDVEDKSIDELRRVLLDRHSIEVGGIICL